MADRDEPRALRIEIAPRTLIYAIAIGMGLWIAWQLWTVVVVLIIALVLVGTLDPMVAWIERRHIPRGWALAIVFVVLIAAFVGVLFLSIPPLLLELKAMAENAPKYREQLLEFLSHYKWAAPFAKAINEVPLDDIVKYAVSYSFNLLSVLGYGATTLFLAIYLLADPRHAKGLLYALVPRKHHVKTARILLELKTIVGGYMRGQVITSIAITIFMFLLMTAFKVENALSIAIFAGFTDVIPFVGGYIASAPAVVAVSNRGAAIMVLVAAAAMLYQEFESRILVPRVYGRVLRLSPALVLLALLIGGTLLGVLGALLALPIAAGLRMLVLELRVELPGQPDQVDQRARDERAEVLYEKLTAGTPAADAQIIAGELAEKIKETETKGGSLTAEIPAIIMELGEDAREVAQQAEQAEEARREEAARDSASRAASAPTPDEPKKG